MEVAPDGILASPFTLEMTTTMRRDRRIYLETTSCRRGGSISKSKCKRQYVEGSPPTGHTDTDIYEGFIRLSFLGPNFPGFRLARGETGFPFPCFSPSPHKIFFLSFFPCFQ